uniref:Uncharacterized protein n=1 Tax=Rhizophora mucronata TaxID=61149 RepID=A0A2P2L643_RHIMU
MHIFIPLLLVMDILVGCSKVVRLSIARVLTVISQAQKAALRKVYKNKKFLPLDLRPKKTRAIRRRLTKHQVLFRFLTSVMWMNVFLDGYLTLIKCFMCLAIVGWQSKLLCNKLRGYSIVRT